MDWVEIRDFYKDQVGNRFVPYWLPFADMEYGGVLNCISNNGEILRSDRKYTWSQGRWLYILSLLMAIRAQLPDTDYSKIEESAALTSAFIIKHCFDCNGRSVFITERDGKWITDENGEYHKSVYADCFSVIGLAEYAAVTGDNEVKKTAEFLMSSVMKRAEDGFIPSFPYEIPAGFRSHGIPMILSNTAEVAASMLESFGESSDELRAYQRKCVDSILSDFFNPETGLVSEYISLSDYTDTLLCRHINPGHVLEDAWFWIECLEHSNDLPLYFNRISSIVKNTFKLSWDSEYGGLLRFVDKCGGSPYGRLLGNSYEKLVLDTWHMKLWWPHSEMLYLFLRLYSISGDREYASMYEIVKEYAFSVFPSASNGEWDQIRRRNGDPEDSVVALPVKDPFHILRDFIKIIKLAEENIC